LTCARSTFTRDWKIAWTLSFPTWHRHQHRPLRNEALLTAPAPCCPISPDALLFT
jgi:hypothetical protein